MQTVATPDEYLAQFEPPILARLLAVRALFQSLLPQASEVMKYGIPTFVMKKNVIHYAGYKNHIGIYPGAGVIAHFHNELKGYTTSKGTVQIPHHMPLPEDLLRKLVAYRLKEMQGK